MGIEAKARDWQVSSLAQVGGAGIVGGGVFFFAFRSQEARALEHFMFLGYGLGVAGSVGGASASPKGFTPIKCERSMSVIDLNGSPGRLTLAAGAFMFGWGTVVISAFDWGGAFFSSQTVPGWSVGVGIGAMTTAGFWRSVRLAGRDAQRNARSYLGTVVPEHPKK